MTRRASVSWRPLVMVTSANYVAQVPYFIHNDYSAAHPLPGVRAIALLGATLAWFVVGMIGITRHRRWGYAVLMSYLLTEALFYAATIISGVFVGQIENPSMLLRVIFVMGYASGAVAAYYAVRIFRERGRERRGDDRRSRTSPVRPPVPDEPRPTAGPGRAPSGQLARPRAPTMPGL